MSFPVLPTAISDGDPNHEPHHEELHKRHNNSNEIDGFNPLYFGALIDGATDDSTAFSATITAANAVASGGAVVTLPPGIMRIVTSPTWHNKMIFQGQGVDVTTIKFDPAGATWLLQAAITGVEFRDMTIQAAGAAAGLFDILDASNQNNFRRVKFKGYNTTTPIAIRFSGQTSCCCYHHFYDCIWDTWHVGIWFSGFANANKDFGGFFQTCDTAIKAAVVGSDTLAGGQNLFVGTHFGFGVPVAVSMTSAANDYTFVGAVWDGPTVALQLGGGTGHTFLGCTFGSATKTLNNNTTVTFAGCDLPDLFPGTVNIGGMNGALATTATKGFLSLPYCAGTPTGVVNAEVLGMPMIIDTSARKIWVNVLGTWRYAALT